jgi:hypothetical protein
MERKITFPLYIGAFLLSLTVFLAGIFVGRLIDTSSMEGISEDLSSVSQKMTSVHLLLLMEGNSSSFCPVYKSELRSIDEDVELMGHKLSYLEDEKGVYDNELKKEYFALEASSYLLSKKVRELCGDDSVLLINFYSNTNCSGCKEQGIEILKARDALASSGTMVKLYSFDGDLGSPIVEAFKTQYGVAGYPSIVIDGVTYAGYKDAEELESIVREMQ